MGRRKLLNNEQDCFLRTIVSGTRSEDVAKIMNERFGLQLTGAQIKNYKSHNDIKSGKVKQRQTLLTPEQDCFFRKIAKGKWNVDIAKSINDKFGLNLQVKQIITYKKNHHIQSSIPGRFPKGHIPANKGKIFPGQINSGCFKKGDIPKNYLPVGTEIKKSDGYIWIKIADPNRWRQKQLLIWEEHNGPVPAGSIIIFLDQDRSNCDIDNLALITKQEHVRMNQNHLYTKDRQLTKVGVGIAKIFTAVGKRKKTKAMMKCLNG